MENLIDDFIICHSSIDYTSIREKGIIIVNELIFRSEIAEKIEMKWFNAQKYIVRTKNHPYKLQCQTLKRNMYGYLSLSSRLYVCKKLVLGAIRID